MTEFIAGLALCTSVLLLIVQYRNLVERRHGELAKLRADILTRLYTVSQRFTSCQLHIETIRLELRRMDDCDDKYNLIEEMPSLIDAAETAKTKLVNIQASLEQLDTEKENRASLLMKFQSSEHLLRGLEDMVSKAEQSALNVLREMRSNMEAIDEKKRIEVPPISRTPG